MSVHTLTPEAQLASGLGQLVEAAKQINRILYSEDGRKPYEHVTELPRHPFGLPVLARTDLRRWKGIAFLGHPGITDASVKSFGAYVLDRLTYEGEAATIRTMRVIAAERDPQQPDHHEIYLEVAVGGDVFMCGGCSDCSGAGGAGRRQLEALFAAFSRLTGVEIERVTIPYAQAQPAVQAIERACDRRER